MHPTLFSDFCAARVLYEDKAIIVVDKPVGVSCQSADPAWPDDLPFRLERFLSHRDGTHVKLGVHQRLDKATSGVILYAKQRAANRGLAAQFEGRTVEKTYVAAVSRWTRSLKEDVTLRDFLVPGKRGRMEKAHRNDRRAKLAVTHARLLRQVDDRSLLRVTIETGRTHQVRAQLSWMGSPVAGDVLYGPSAAQVSAKNQLQAAPRLMLHALRLRLNHPMTGQPLVFEAPMPSVFEPWLAGRSVAAHFDDVDKLVHAVRVAAEARFGLWQRWLLKDTTAFRLVHGAGDGLPGLVVDVYGGHLVAQLHDDALAHEATIVKALDTFGFEGVYVKRRPRQANELVETRRESVAPALPVCGHAAADPLVIYEHGVPYETRLGDGLSTGIFLDQRKNRVRVREACASAKSTSTKPTSAPRVLNLFSYACAFNIAAAAGGAHHTVAVDAAGPALRWGEAQLAKFANFAKRADHKTANKHQCVQQDVFAFLEHAIAVGACFDLVIVDPPTYSTTRTTRWSSGRQWRRLAALALQVTRPRGGALLFCSNDHRLTQAAFRRLIHQAARDAKRSMQQLKELSLPHDFPVAASKEPHLKSLWATLA